MNKFILFAMLLCLMAVNARHYGERENPETLTDEETQSDFDKEKQHTSQTRHRRRRWQNYGYDYQPPQYFAHRRDSYNNQEVVIADIYRLLEDIATSLRRSQQTPPPPPPPPQPVYVPYPVPYFVPRYTACKSEVPKVNLTQRFPDLDDVNRNWGFVTNEVPDEVYDDSDGSRPVSFDPIKPKQNIPRRPAPAVEHGSVQSKNQLTTQAPVFDEIPPSVSKNLPSMCTAAILSCCSINDEAQKKQCFTDVGCSKTYAKGDACTPESVREALDAIKSLYSPMN